MTAIALSDGRRARMWAEAQHQLEHGHIVQRIGTYERAMAVYNIITFQLFHEGGHQTITAWAEATGYSYRRIKQLGAVGRDIAEMAFDKHIPADKRILTLGHVRKYVEAMQEARLLAKSDMLRLPEEIKTELDFDSVLDDRDRRLIGKQYRELEAPATAPQQTQRKGEHAELLVSTISRAAIQTYELMRERRGFHRSTKKQQEAWYYLRLTTWYLTNGVTPATHWISFEDALALHAAGDDLPDHLSYALGLDERLS